MRVSTARLVTCLAVPVLTTASASAQLRFEEFLVNGTGTGNHFFEFSANSTADFGPGTALIVISGNRDTGGNITSFLDLNIDFSVNSFPTNGLFFAQPNVVTGVQPNPSALPDVLLDYNPDPDPQTFFLGGGDLLFPVFEPSATYALVGGFTGSTATDLDTNNDGIVDTALPFTTVYDAVTLLASENNIEDLLDGTETTPRFTGLGYADDFSAAFAPAASNAFPQGQFAFFDQRFDEFVGVSPDGPDGFFRFTDGTPATFDVNVQSNGIDFVPGNADDGDGPVFEFDGTTGITQGNNAADEEIAFINTLGQTVDAQIPSDSDPLTPGDQGPYLTPGRANNIALPAPGDVGPVLPDPVAPGLEIVTDVIKFGSDKVTPTGSRIAGTSFENEAPGTYTIYDENDPLIGNLDGDANEGELFIGFSEAVEGDDINGDGDFNDNFFIAYRDQRTNSENVTLDDGTVVPGPLGPSDEPSFSRLRMLNDPNDVNATTFNGFVIDNRTQFDGDDNILDTADDVFFDSVVAALNSTASSEAAGDLKYRTTYVDTRPNFEEGFSDADVVGPIDFDYFLLDPTAGGVADGRDGLNAYAVSDTDGSIEVEFQAVDLSDYVDKQFHTLLAPFATGYEAEDLVKIELILTTATGTTREEVLIYEGGDGLEGLGIFGDIAAAQGMGQFLIDLADDVLAAQAIFTFSTSAANENFLFDDVAFFGTLIGDGVGLFGDFNGNGRVEQADLDLVLNNWGSAETPLSFLNNAGLDEAVNQDELDAVLNNWGSSSAPNFRGLNVPEPTVAALAVAGLGLLARRRRLA